MSSHGTNQKRQEKEIYADLEKNSKDIVNAEILLRQANEQRKALISELTFTQKDDEKQKCQTL